MRFVIRDDDLNYFSKPSDIENWYSDIFAQNIPVGFATIPFVKGTSDVYTLSQEDKEFPISLNTELIVYMKNNPLVEILQHGCTHQTINGIYEYARNQDLTYDTLRGKEELERAFNQEIMVFAPPHDWINRKGVEAVEKSGLNIIRGRGTGIKNLKLNLRHLKNFFIMLKEPIFPFVLDFGGHKEMRSFRLEDFDVWKGLENANNRGGIFVVVTHLHHYNQEKKDILLSLIARARKCGAEFVKPGEIFNLS